MFTSDKKLLNFLPDVRGTYRENVDLSKTTWFRVGGQADILFRPIDINDLAFFLKNKADNIEVTIIGAGSNILISDKGVKDVTIKLGKNFNDFEFSGHKLIVGAACLNYNIALLARDHNLTGLEFLSGIPGSIGGSLAMNASAFGNEISNFLESAELIDGFGNIHHLSPSEIKFGYRCNGLPKDFIFTKAVFSLEKEDLSVIDSKLAEIYRLKSTTQPLSSRSCGSSFKNPSGYKAWQLIDLAGCRGLAYGGAKVSELHSNFIVNFDNATASDIRDLGEIIREKVLEKTGISLEWEIKHIGRK